MASDGAVIEFLDAGIEGCPACGCDVQTVARVINRDSGGMPTIDQARAGRCGNCGAPFEGPLAPNGLN
jgi:uncharacterized Zn finger protein